MTPNINIIDLAEKHGQTSYRNRADTKHPAYGFTEEGLQAFAHALLAAAPQAVQATEEMRVCNSEECGWIGPLSETYGYKNSPATLCPECKETTELSAPAHPAEGVPAQAVGEVVLFGDDCKEISWAKGQLPAVGTKLYAHPPQPVLASTQPAAQGLDAEPKLNAAWKARLLDGAPLSRDKYGCGSHPVLPIFFEGVKCKDFFEALGIELRLWFAEYEMEAEAYEAMSDGFTDDGENYNAWTPKKPEGDGWCLVAIFDTEDGAACWWLRDAAFAAQVKQGGA